MRQINSRENRSWPAAVFLSPVLWGGLLTIGFYSLIPHLPIHRELAERYFCSHPLEYATAILFFVGIAIVGLKGVGIPVQKSALALDLLDDSRMAKAADPLRKITLIEQKLESLPARLRQTHLVQRIGDACAFIRGRESGEGLEDYLKYRAEISCERLHESYALVRTITWAVPILGFLGTVIGITLAIANLEPDQLVSSLGEVTGGLAVAFDTTALALALSLVLVFSSFLVERSEQRILAQVEEYGIRRIASLFPPAPEARGTLADAEVQAARQLAEKTESLINWQTGLWQEMLEGIRSRWTESLETQKASFDASLRQGMQDTLADHSSQLTEIRGEFLHAFQNASQELCDGLAEFRQGQTESQKVFESQVSELLDELRKQGGVLLKIVEQEENLARLQGRLTENLEALRAAEAFEETLHSLSAAVHLLTARTKPKAA